MHKPVPDPLSYAELVKIARRAKESSTRDWCMIVMALTHGLRGAEVCGLTLNDVQDDHVRVIRKKGSLPTLHPISALALTSLPRRCRTTWTLHSPATLKYQEFKAYPFESSGFRTVPSRRESMSSPSVGFGKGHSQAASNIARRSEFMLPWKRSELTGKKFEDF